MTYNKQNYNAGKLAGSLSEYAKTKPFPSNEDMHIAFAKGMSSTAKSNNVIIRWYHGFSSLLKRVIRFKIWNIAFWTIVLCLVASGIAPRDRITWCMEVPWIFAGIGIMAWLHLRGTRISMLLGWSLFIHAVILIYGGYYTYEQAPPGFWMQDIFGFTRNHYDRIGHFAQGFFPAVLYREILYRNHVVNGRKNLEIIVFACCMAFTAIFEIIEFSSAMLFGNASALYLGSQGDIWDAQWDMVFCGIGGIISIITLSRVHKKQMDDINKV